MSKEKNRLGSDPLGWIRPTREEPSEAPKTIEELSKDAQPQKKTGRPRTIKRKITKTSQEGLPANWTRATFIMREDLLKKLKDYAYTERETIRDVINEAVELYLQDKEIIERGEE
jgi:hypothetical protein